VRKISRKSRRPVSDDSQAKTSDLFTEVRYKSLPLIAKINPVNLGDKDKPRLISRTYKPKKTATGRRSDPTQVQNQTPKEQMEGLEKG
jgi:hypothetical protein